MMYEVVAKMTKEPFVEVAVSGNYLQAVNYRVLLETAFNNVEVINKDTGEVIYIHYISTDYFEPQQSVGKCLENLEKLRLALLER